MSAVRAGEPTPWTRLEQAGAVAVKVCAALVGALVVAVLGAFFAGGAA